MEQVVAHFGGQQKTAKALARTQSRISDYVRSGKPPAEVCIKIELATDGKFPAEQLRPDLARDFAAFRKRPAPKAKKAGAA